MNMPSSIYNSDRVSDLESRLGVSVLILNLPSSLCGMDVDSWLCKLYPPVNDDGIMVAPHDWRFSEERRPITETVPIFGGANFKFHLRPQRIKHLI